MALMDQPPRPIVLAAAVPLLDETALSLRELQRPASRHTKGPYPRCGQLPELGDTRHLRHIRSNDTRLLRCHSIGPLREVRREPLFAARNICHLAYIHNSSKATSLRHSGELGLRNETTAFGAVNEKEMPVEPTRLGLDLKRTRVVAELPPSPEPGTELARPRRVEGGEVHVAATVRKRHEAHTRAPLGSGAQTVLDRDERRRALEANARWAGPAFA